MDIVTSDGTTLLARRQGGGGRDHDRGGVVPAQPRHPRGVIKVGFTPDEEIGKGADHFDVKRFGADFAYTMDGGPLGEIEYETFNAFGATVTIDGVGVHPGYAKNKLVNAIRVLAISSNASRAS